MNRNMRNTGQGHRLRKFGQQNNYFNKDVGKGTFQRPKYQQTRTNPRVHPNQPVTNVKVVGPQINGNKSAIIRRNLAAMRESMLKKKKAQEAFYNKNARSPLVQNEMPSVSGSVAERLGSKLQYNRNLTTQTNFRPENIRRRNNVNIRNSSLVSDAIAVNRNRRGQISLQLTSPNNKPRMQNKVRKMKQRIPQNFIVKPRQINTVNPLATARPPNVGRHSIANKLNPAIQKEIQLIQSQRLRANIVGVPTYTFGVTGIPLNERFSLI